MSYEFNLTYFTPRFSTPTVSIMHTADVELAVSIEHLNEPINICKSVWFPTETKLT